MRNKKQTYLNDFDSLEDFAHQSSMTVSLNLSASLLIDMKLRRVTDLGGLTNPFDRDARDKCMVYSLKR